MLVVATESAGSIVGLRFAFVVGSPLLRSSSPVAVRRRFVVVVDRSSPLLVLASVVAADALERLEHHNRVAADDLGC